MFGGKAKIMKAAAHRAAARRRLAHAQRRIEDGGNARGV
jgi:hypothetical protein